MTTRGHMGTSPQRKPFWHQDARERLRAFLPELVISVVASTCTSAVLGFSDDTGIVRLLMVMGIAEVLVQSMLYTLTYLVANDQVQGLGFFIGLTVVSLSTPLIIFVSSNMVPYEIAQKVGISMIWGMVLFYLTRLRWTFVFLLLEILVLSGEFSQQTAPLAVHFVGAGALMALFVMRSSATRMTIFYSPEEPFAAARDSDEPDSRLQLGIYGQVAALGAAIGMLCLAATLVGSLVLGRGFRTGGSVTETTTATGTNTTQEQQPSETPMDATVADDRPDSTAPTEPTDDATAPSERPPEPVTDERAGFLESIGYFLVGLFVCLLPLLPILPFAFRLFRRRLVRHSIGREPRTADKAARLYQGIISRLAAAEIERDETETPQEFLLFHRTELEELMASSGFGLDEWQELTDAYERVRYAELDPTASELELCWKLYDALPACVRKAVGWRSYLLDAFWGM